MKNRIIGFYQYDDNGKKAYCVAEDNNGAVELRKVENDDEALKDLQRFCRYQRINNDNLDKLLKSSKFGTNLTGEDLEKTLTHEFGNRIHQNDISNFLNNIVPVPGSSDDEYDYDDQDDENLSLREKVRNKFDSLRQSYLDYRRDRKTKKAAKKAEKEEKEEKKKLSTRGKITIAVATVAALAITGFTSFFLNRNNGESGLAYIPSNTNRNTTSQSSTPEPEVETPTEEVVTTPNTVTQESSATSTYTNQETTNHTATTVTTPTTSTDSTANMPAPQDSDPNNFNTNKQEAIDSLNRDEPITDPEVHIYDEYIEEDGSLVDYITGVTTDDTGLNEELPDPNAEEETKEDSDLADVIIKEEAPYVNDQAVQSNEEQTVESEAYSSSQQFAVTSDVYVNEQDRATYVIGDDGNGYVYLPGDEKPISIVPVVQETENSTSLQYEYVK